MLWDLAEMVSAVASHTMACLSSVHHIPLPLAWVAVPLIVSLPRTNDMGSGPIPSVENIPCIFVLLQKC